MAKGNGWNGGLFVGLSSEGLVCFSWCKNVHSIWNDARVLPLHIHTHIHTYTLARGKCAKMWIQNPRPPPFVSFPEQLFTTAQLKNCVCVVFSSMHTHTHTIFRVFSKQFHSFFYLLLFNPIYNPLNAL